MAIKIEHISQKNLINFYFPQSLWNEPRAILATIGNVYNFPLVNSIMSIDNVVKCLLTENLIAVRYDNNADIDTLKALLLAEIDDFLLDNESYPTPAPQPMTASLMLANAVADVFIRPTLQRDNGDIRLLYLKNGVLGLEFTGHCAGCPYAQNTLNNVIIKTMQRYLPDIQKVCLGNKI